MLVPVPFREFSHLIAAGLIQCVPTSFSVVRERQPLTVSEENMSFVRERQLRTVSVEDLSSPQRMFIAMEKRENVTSAS